jgi:hypothetical protein
LDNCYHIFDGNLASTETYNSNHYLPMNSPRQQKLTDAETSSFKSGPQSQVGSGSIESNLNLLKSKEFSLLATGTSIMNSGGFKGGNSESKIEKLLPTTVGNGAIGFSNDKKSISKKIKAATKSSGTKVKEIKNEINNLVMSSYSHQEVALTRRLKPKTKGLKNFNSNDTSKPSTQRALKSAHSQNFMTMINDNHKESLCGFTNHKIKTNLLSAQSSNRNTHLSPINQKKALETRYQYSVSNSNTVMGKTGKGSTKAPKNDTAKTQKDEPLLQSKTENCTPPNPKIPGISN